MIESLLAPVTVMAGSLFLIVLVGTVAGVFTGAVPGLTGAMVIALALSLTETMDKEPALALLVAMYVGAVGGGLITATLLRMPGTPASIMTTLDGYPMAQRGEARRALALGIGASLVGGLVSWLVLVLVAGSAAQASTALGPWEKFSLVLVALVLIATISKGQLLRGLFAGALGCLLAMPGPNPATGAPRFTFGIQSLNGGLDQVIVLIGLFALAQVFRESAKGIDATGPTTVGTPKGSFPSIEAWSRQTLNLLRSSTLGTIIGILPGVGANVGSVVAYSTARAAAPPEEQAKFGKGSDSGIVASEAANNATVGGALVPLLALGIPGSVVDVVLLAAFVMHEVQPGPLLLEQNPTVFHTITGSYLVANLIMVVLMVAGVRFIARLAQIPRWILLPAILVFCVVGAYAKGNSAFQVWVMILFGFVGVLLERFRIPLAPLVIGFVLAGLAEKSLVAGLKASGGSFAPLVSRPISAVLVVTALLLLLVPYFKSRRPMS